MADQQKTRAVKEQYEQQWMAMKEVAAIGLGKVDDEFGIIISVKENPGKVRSAIPARIQDVPIRIKQTGEFKAQ